MNVIVNNSIIAVEVDLMGAQMQSIKTVLSGMEYLWQGDPKSWADRAPNLFPIVGVVPDNKYTFQGLEYEMPIHGFVKKCNFEVISQTNTKAILKNSATENTKINYPFDYDFIIKYETSGNTLEITHQVKNNSDCNMPFSMGEHPGFRVPLTAERHMLSDGIIAFLYNHLYCSRCEERSDVAI